MNNQAFAFSVLLIIFGLTSLEALSDSSSLRTALQTAQEQRAEIIIKNYDFVLTQPMPIRLHTPTVIILRNQDIVRHGFTSPMLSHLLVRGEGEGVAAYGKSIDGFYVDPGKTLVIRFTPERTGKYSFKCDLHPDMKGEFYSLEIPAA